MPAPGRVRILGVDPGSLRLGYGVVDRIGKAQLGYVECGVITAPARLSRAERLTAIGRGLRDLVDELRPDEVAMEQAFYGKNVQSTLALGEARGMVTFIVRRSGVAARGLRPRHGETLHRRPWGRHQAADWLSGTCPAGPAPGARAGRRRRPGHRHLPCPTALRHGRPRAAVA